MHLLISCLAGDGMPGGLLVFDGRSVERIDSLPTAGLACDGRRLVRVLDTSCEDRGVETSRLLVYDERGLRHHHRLEGVTSPHGVHWDGEAVAVVATTQNRVVWFGEDGRELRRWQAPGEDESWHLNDVVEADGRLYVCAFGRFERAFGWKDPGEPSGCVVAIDGGAVAVGGLERPHSPRLMDGRWLVCSSATGELLAVDPATGRAVRRQEVGTWPRGLAVDDRRIYVGSSRLRGSRGSRPATVHVLDRTTWVRLATIEVPSREVFDLQLVPPEIVAGVRRGLRASGRCRQRRPSGGLRIVQTYERPRFGEPERTIGTLTGEWLDAGHEVWTWLPASALGSAGPPEDLPGVVCDAYPREVAPDVVVVHGGLHGAASAGLSEPLTGAPVVEVVHRRRPALPGATAYVAVSRAVAAVQTAVRCTVVPPGVRAPVPRASSAAVRAEHGIGPDDFVVVRHAEIETDKGWHWTMQVMRQAWASGLPAWLLVAGGATGPAAAVLAAWAARHPRVVLASCDGPASLLAAGDVALETSPSEGFGLAVAEAGLLELPVVAFAAPGVSETVGRSYPTVALGDTAAAAAMLLQLAGDATARVELGRRLRARVARRHDPGTTARRYVRLFESLLV